MRIASTSRPTPAEYGLADALWPPKNISPTEGGANRFAARPATLKPTG
jgi:hypothetical protein